MATPQDPTALGDLRLRFSLRCSAPWSRESARHFKFKKERAGGQAGEREGARGGLLGACPDCGAALFCRRAPRSPRSVQRGSGARRVPETLQGWRSGWQSGSCASQRREAGTGAAEQRQRRESTRGPNGGTRGEYAPRPTPRERQAQVPWAGTDARSPSSCARHPGPLTLRASAPPHRSGTATRDTEHAGRPSPAQPLRALRIAWCPAPVCTHAVHPAVYTPPLSPHNIHTPHVHTRHPGCPNCLCLGLTSF